MRLPDGREVPDLHVDPAAVARCRVLADQVTGQVMGFVERHTTVSIERTGAAAGLPRRRSAGDPLVNLMVDALHERGLLGKGAAWWFGWALRQGARDPMQVVERITGLPRQPAGLSPVEDRALRDEVTAEAKAAAEELRRRVESRNALRVEALGMGPRPHKYLIVATGNIHDDVEQARAAAQAGADIIAVIRSTAQSLLDYVPHGATTEGYGGTYATQENFRIMREALDAESRRLRRYVMLTNYASGLWIWEIAFAAAWERLDMLLNDAMYGILSATST